MAHKALVGGTAYEITKGKTLVSGTGYEITSGRTLVGGTAYEIGFASFKYTITNIGNYGFVQNSNGYYESNNKGVHSSFAMCRIDVTADGEQTIALDCINYAESNYDFGIVSNWDQALTQSYTEDTSSTIVFRSFKGASSSSVVTLQLPTPSKGKHTLYIKYRKDGSENNNNDSLQFKIRVVQVPPLSYSVSNISGATYGFALNSSGYYESQNKGVDSSYAICRINFTTDGVYSLAIDCINSAEQNYDFGLISNLDSSLSLSNSTDSSVYQSFQSVSTTAEYRVLFVTPSMGSHFIDVKYKKDGSVNSNNDSLQFKVSFTTNIAVG